MVLAKIRRPSSTPFGEHAEIFVEQQHVGGVFGDIGGESTEIPTSAGEGERVVDPVAEEGDARRSPLRP